MIPRMIEFHDDELFCSYMTRLAKENGIKNLQEFIGRELNKMTDVRDIGHIKWNFDGYGLFVPFFKTNGINKLQFIQHCSLYPYQSVFLTPRRQAMTVDWLFNAVHARVYSKITPMVSNLYYCKQCREEELKEFGHHYFHRAHQLPGVSVCHKHHTPLFAIDGSPVQIFSDCIDYAEFSADLLFAGLQSNIEQIQKVTTENWIDENIPNLSVPLYQKETFFSSKYTTIPDIIRILMHTFGTIKNLKKYISPDNKLIHKFINHTMKYDVYQPFNTSIVEMHHKVCGTDFFTTPAGFLKGWTCPSCFSEKKDSSVIPFEQSVANLVGDEYTVTGEYKGRNEPVEIRHNTCGHAHTYRAKHFLNGFRCPECTRIVSTERFFEMVKYMTEGQYTVIKKSSPTLFEIAEAGGKTIEVSIPMFLQEILRPTPSNILPVPVKSLHKDWNVWDAESVKFVSKQDLFLRICEFYKEDELIFMEDLRTRFPDGYQSALKSGIRTLIEDKKLFRIDKGIYTLTPRTVSPEDLVREKYLIRNKKRIGIYDSQSLAYEMGMLTEKPKKLFIMTNMESQAHGRNRTVNGIPVHIRGCPVMIDETNYQYIMVMEALKYCRHYGNGRDYRIRQFIREQNLSFEPFISLFPYYSETIQKDFKNMRESL